MTTIVHYETFLSLLAVLAAIALLARRLKDSMRNNRI
jgi:uncharacterized membrane protein YhaH (DUF805 family)